MHLSEQTPIYIYGATTKGLRLAHCLLKNGYFFRGIIDRRSNQYNEIDGISLLAMDEVKELLTFDTWVILALNNGLLHESIAEELYCIGVQYIVYLPFYRGYSFERQRRRRQEYALFFDEKKLRDGFDSLQFDEKERLMITNISEDIPMIQDTDHIVIHINRDMLCIRDAEQRLGDDKERKTNQELYQPDKTLIVPGCLVMDLVPYLDMWQALSDGGMTLPNSYLRIMGKEKLAEATYRDRKSLFEYFGWVFAECREVFSETAATAIWDEKGYFVVLDGLHRCTYLIFRGEQKVPIRISMQDYKSWKRSIKGIE